MSSDGKPPDGAIYHVLLMWGHDILGINPGNVWDK